MGRDGASLGSVAKETDLLAPQGHELGEVGTVQGQALRFASLET